LNLPVLLAANYLRFTIHDLLSSIMEEREEFLTARQLAKVLQVSEATVRRLARKRRIPSVRVTPHIIRFHLDAVREALDVPRSRIRHGEFTEPVDDAQLSFDDLTPLRQ
jgi:excisionase family DNA binding protein